MKPVATLYWIFLYRWRAARYILRTSPYLVLTGAFFGAWFYSHVRLMKVGPHREKFPRSHLWVAEKNLKLCLSVSGRALNLAKEYIRDWVQGYSLGTWAHLFIFMTQRNGRKSILSKMLSPTLPVHPSILLSGAAEWTWEATRGYGVGYWFVLNGACELNSAPSHTNGELPSRCRCISVICLQRGIYSLIPSTGNWGSTIYHVPFKYDHK